MTGRTLLEQDDPGTLLWTPARSGGPKGRHQVERVRVAGSIDSSVTTLTIKRPISPGMPGWTVSALARSPQTALLR